MLVLTLVFGVNVDANVNTGFSVPTLTLMLTLVFSVSVPLTLVFSVNTDANVNIGFRCQC